MRKRICLLLFLMGLVPGLVFSAGLTQVEKGKIESDVLNTFQIIFDAWRDGKCADLYEYGARKSQSSVSKEDFANKMRKKSYEMALSWERIRDIETEVTSHKSVYVKAKIGYRKKGGGDTRYLTQTYRMVFEGDRWRIDLSRVLSCPF
jgi:hypothetical protein